MSLAIDLFCGLGGWTNGLLAEGWDVIGYDIERYEYDGMKYKGKLIIRDVRTLHGSQFKNADLIVASPPCQKYSYMAMPWSRGKRMRERYIDNPKELEKLNELFNTCFRLQDEAIEAAGRFIPLIVENVRGAQDWVGQSRWNYGSFHLWGDVPALMPMNIKQQKVSGQNFSNYKKTGEVSPHWNQQYKKALSDTYHTEGVTDYRLTTSNIEKGGIKHGGNWWDDPTCMTMKYSSKSNQRKKASAMIAMIPLELSQHIAQVYKPS